MGSVREIGITAGAGEAGEDLGYALIMLNIFKYCPHVHRKLSTKDAALEDSCSEEKRGENIRNKYIDN